MDAVILREIDFYGVMTGYSAIAFGDDEAANEKVCPEGKRLR